MIVGWDPIKGFLEYVQVLLLIAPESTGKRSSLLQFKSPGDNRWIDEYDIFAPNERLTPQLAREAISFLNEKSLAERWAILRLQQERPQNILLKTLEDPPPNTKIILLAEQDPLPTVMSRAQITLRRGPLTETELTTIMIQQGFNESVITRAAHAGGVRQAREIASTERFRSQALTAAKAVQTLDRALLRRALEDWTQECSDALTQWCSESMSRVPRIHTTEELGNPTVARMILFTMMRCETASPQLSANNALHAAFEAVKGAK